MLAATAGHLTVLLCAASGPRRRAPTADAHSRRHRGAPPVHAPSRGARHHLCKRPHGMAELLEITADEQDDRIPAAARFSLGVEKRIHAWHRSCEEGRRWRAWSRAWPSSAKLGARSARRSAFRGALLIRTLFAVVMMSPFASPARAADDSTVGTIVRAAASESSSHFLCKLDSSGFGTTVLVSGYE